MMAKNKHNDLSASELDKLMKQAFLNLDFKQPQNAMLLDEVGNRLIGPSGLYTPMQPVTFLKLMSWITLVAIITTCGLYLYIGNTPHNRPLNLQSPANPGPVVHRSDLSPELHDPGYSATPIKNPAPGKSATNHLPAADLEEKVLLTGQVSNQKTGAALAGAVVYELISSIGATADEQGRYSIILPKGEHQLAVTLLAYQQFTFSVLLEGNTVKDLKLSPLSRELEEVVVRPEPYIFPNLTEKEKRANEKEKQKMAKLLARSKQEKARRDDKYPFIPPSPDKAFEGFNIGSFEITNLEYRTFLFDLLINERKEEFLAAKPEQHLWISAAGVEFFDTLALAYFSEKKYNSFPVVNIPVKGVQIYCNWLADQANIIRRKEGKPEILVRLPYENEWIYAASAGRAGAVYPWPIDSVQNHVNWFLANCCVQKLSDKLRYPLGRFNKRTGDSRYAGDTTAYTAAGMTLGNKRIATIEVFAYNPNDFYLYCMSGNVSEMVYASDNTLKTKGGNWASDFEHLKINSEDEFKTVTPSPLIGFRVCLEMKK